MGVGAGGGEADSGGACAKANSLSHAVGESGCHCRLHGPPPPIPELSPTGACSEERGEPEFRGGRGAPPTHTLTPGQRSESPHSVL